MKYKYSTHFWVRPHIVITINILSEILSHPTTVEHVLMSATLANFYKKTLICEIHENSPRKHYTYNVTVMSYYKGISTIM